MTTHRQIQLIFLVGLVIISATFAITTNNVTITTNETSITCNPVYIVMEQWLNDPNELRCYKT